MKRRTFIKDSTFTAFSVAGFGSISWNGKSFEGNSVTTSDILGPFYRPGSPMRSNLIPPGSMGDMLHLVGTVFNCDGKTPLPDVIIEAWQCDENEHYDNISDDYLFRGTVKTGIDGKYTFKTIIPVPYKDGEDWRPAHIHLRFSSGSCQDLITQIYFKGDPHIEEDASSRSPQSVNRILEIKKNASNENVVKFDVVMGKSFVLSDSEYKNITGLYKLENGMAEFIKEDDLLIFKLNGQILEGFKYKGNHSFEGGIGFNKLKFELFPDGDVKVKITLWEGWSEDNKFLETYEGVKFLNYGNR